MELNQKRNQSQEPSKLVSKVILNSTVDPEKLLKRKFSQLVINNGQDFGELSMEKIDVDTLIEKINRLIANRPEGE